MGELCDELRTAIGNDLFRESVELPDVGKIESCGPEGCDRVVLVGMK